MALVWALVVTLPWSLFALFRPRRMGLHALANISIIYLENFFIISN